MTELAVFHRRGLASLLAATIALWTMPIARAESGGFRRGASIHNLMNWADVLPSDATRYAWPPFADPYHTVSDALLRNLSTAGFDFIRLTVDPGPFLQFKGERRDALDAYLLDQIGRMRAQGLAVVVDFHPIPRVKAYSPDAFTVRVDDPLFVDYVRMIRRTATLLATLRSRDVAIEPMNEPQAGYDDASARQWQQMAEQLHREIRGVAPDLTIVLTGARGGSREGLFLLDPAPFRESRVLFSFHYYEPYELTHQSVVTDEPSARLWRYLSGLPYPTADVDRERVWRGVEANVSSAADIGPSEKRVALAELRPKVFAYLGGDFGRRRIAADFDSVSTWARQHRVASKSIILGEFGGARSYGNYRAADPISRAAWLRNLREEAEARDFGWAVFEVKGYGGMAILERDDADTLDPGTLRALGLRP